MKTTTARWMNYSDMTTIDQEGGALSVVRTSNGNQIVRPTTDGRFAVILLDGRRAKIVKTLDSVDSARAYNRACGR